MANPSILQVADPSRLEQAAAFNHRELFKKEALTLGGSFFDIEGLCWTSGNAQSPSMVAFPQLREENAGRQLDDLMAWYRVHPPKGAGCWSLDPPSPPDLGVRLLARGFQPGWKPRWMSLDLGQVRTDHSFPRGLTIAADNQASLTGIKNLPYAQVIVPAAATIDMPGQWTRFIATLHGKVVGHSVVFLTTGELGAAGIYHVGVVPRHRKKGIGKAITLAACLYARDKGYRYAVLNSTGAGQRTYEQLGFTVIRDGQTWWLITDRYITRPPSSSDVQLAEAVGRGDRLSLDALRPQLEKTAGLSRYLNRELSSGLTLMELAVHCRQPSAAEWLVDIGADYTVLDAWDLGWQDRARQLLQKDPGSVNKIYGEWNKTLLHFAAERDDADLTRLALTARPDLRLKDSAYQSTALEWARHLGHTRIIELLQDAR